MQSTKLQVVAHDLRNLQLYSNNFTYTMTSWLQYLIVEKGKKVLSALDLGSSSPGWRNCVVCLGKTLSQHPTQRLSQHLTQHFFPHRCINGFWVI